MTLNEDDTPTLDVPEPLAAENNELYGPRRGDAGPIEGISERFAALDLVGEHSMDLMVVIDEVGAVKYANPAALEIFGISLDQGIGTSAFTYLHPEDLDRVAQRFVEILKSPGATMSDTVRAIIDDDEIRELEIVSTNCLDYPAVAGIVINGRDVTERNRYVAELEARENWFLTLMANSSDLIGVLDAQGNATYVGPSNERTSDFKADERIGRSVLELIHPDDYDETAALFYECTLHEGTSRPFVVRAETSSGEWRFLEVVLTNCLGDPTINGVVYNAHDVTDQRAAERARAEAEVRDARTKLAASEAIALSEERFRLAFEGNMAPMLFVDLEDRVTAVNDAFCQMIGRSREEILGLHTVPFTHPDDVGITEVAHRRLLSGEVDQLRYVKRFVRKDGRTITVEVSKYAARDTAGNMLYSVMSARDVTDERELTDQLEHRTLHDPLTGLANRVLFKDRLAQAHTRVVRHGGYGAVLLLDLDDFKGVNDTHGHLIGDRLLVGIARRFELVTRSSDTLSRFGDDEFLYLAEGLTSADEAEALAQRLLDVLAEPFDFAGVHFEQRASVGVVVWDATSSDDSDFVQNADVALHEAKVQGKGRHVVFTPAMHAHAVSRFTLVQELRQALQSGEISMHYQPIVNLTTTRVVGFEALMRWSHPERGPVSPAVFIALAEQSDLILELGAFAIREAVAAVRLWDSTDPDVTRPYVTVNLSVHQFHDPTLVATIEETLAVNDLSPDRLIIEITESAALENITETMSVMEHFNRLGVGVALDDFGTGYSSLSYLLLLRPRIIKIDQSFVRPKHDSVQNASLLETIVSLGNKLHMTMLAEGIETRGQYEQLRDLNCELGQGFLWSPAVPLNEAAAIVGRVFDR